MDYSVEKIYEQVRRELYSFLPDSPDKYLQIVDLWDAPKKEPKGKICGYPVADIYFRYEDISKVDIEDTLRKETITLCEGVHLIVGVKMSKLSSLILSKPFYGLYKQVIHDIEKGELKPEHVDEDKAKIKELFDSEVTFSSSESDVVIKIQDTQHGNLHYFKPHILLEWALSKGFFIHRNVLESINLITVAQDSFFLDLPTNYLVESEPKKMFQKEVEEVALLATAQVLWDISDPSMTITAMEGHKLIKRLIPGGEYSNRHIFRNKVKVIDPRPKGRKKRIGAISKKEKSHTPKLIPGVVFQQNDDQPLYDFFRLKMVCRAIIKSVIKILPDISEDQLYNCSLIQAYLRDAHHVIKEMVKEWIKEIRQE